MLALKGASREAPPEADGMTLDQVDERNSPFPLINTNLLLVQSKERRRKLRGGDSFVLTPRYCGSNATGWVDCQDLMGGRMTLSTAMAVSGAAANPNTGAGGVGLTRNRLISVLMAFIGLRLGYWLPNFGRDRPPFWLPNHVWPGLSTALPFGHHEDDWFLELSDGGHFENLGLYELVRRRPRLIIVCDGAQDPDFAFEDLQCAQRRVTADFGATVKLTVAELERLIPYKTDHRFPESDLRLAENGYIVGTIRYADEQTATLIYLKTTLIEDLPVALLGYRGANPAFPDQSTADQFFDEEQFEAYRELGFIIATAMMRDRDVQAAISEALGPGATCPDRAAQPAARDDLEPRQPLGQQRKKALRIDLVDDGRIGRAGAATGPVHDGAAERVLARGLDRNVAVAAGEQLGPQQVGDHARVVHRRAGPVAPGLVEDVVELEQAHDRPARRRCRARAMARTRSGVAST